MGRGLATTILAASVTALAACTPPQQRTPPPIGASPNPIRDRAHPQAGVWPYWPESMRIHPLTRLIGDDTGNHVIEARVELRDRDGHTTKGTGLLRLDLYDTSDESPGGSLAEWNLDLRDAALNRERFDDVTLTYLFRLEVEADQLPQHPVVWAYFLADDGADLTARFEVPRR